MATRGSAAAQRRRDPWRPRRRVHGVALITLVVGLAATVGVMVAVSRVAPTVGDEGSSGACTVSLDSAEKGALAYWAGHGGEWPVSFDELVTAEPPYLSLREGVNQVSPTQSNTSNA